MKKNIDTQLKWVILLLAIAVILPTICLLWFMTQAVRNERLAIRQKLIDSYSARGQELFNKNAEYFAKDANNFSSTVQYVPQMFTSDSESLKKAEQLEFVDANYAGALKEYELIAKLSSNPNTVYDGMIGHARCLIKLNRIDEAIDICRQCMGEKYFKEEQKAKAGLLLIKLATENTEAADKINILELLKNQLLIFSTEIPTETKVFIFSESIKIANETGLDRNLQAEILAAQKFIKSANLTISAIDFLNQYNISTEPNESFFKIATAPLIYGIYRNNNLLLVTEEKMHEFWEKNINVFSDELVFCRIYDNKGTQIAGQSNADGELFKTLKLELYFNNWKTELYLRSGVFNQAADKKRLIYIWVASIVIVLMLSSSILAGKSVFKQARVNKLKNDFIATVTHELKTPLSSMRVLVDTLLDGKCKDRQHEIEYLQLISKENARLSRLIDTFLTFSRMERNKQVFDFCAVNPDEIARAAAEAVHAKFEKANVHFSMSIENLLPMINVDKDAITTVMVNLLDNAYKYSYDNKQIELKVFAENSNVCFAVKDNGIGMTRRHMNKIFERFYQADTSLSRRAEGAGLGLSIVKFIVDAHKGKINVESKIAKGSQFTVMLTTNKRE